MNELEQMRSGAVMVFDRQVLMRQTMDDEALASQVLGLFINHLNRLESSDWKTLEMPFEMHTLQGAAASVGAVQIQDLTAKWRAQGAELEAKMMQAAKAFRLAAQAF
jgi:hypothetical protein